MIMDELRTVEEKNNYKICLWKNVEGNVYSGIFFNNLLIYKYDKSLQPSDNYNDIVEHHKEKIISIEQMNQKKFTVFVEEFLNDNTIVTNLPYRVNIKNNTCIRRAKISKIKSINQLAAKNINYKGKDYNIYNYKYLKEIDSNMLLDLYENIKIGEKEEKFIEVINKIEGALTKDEGESKAVMNIHERDLHPYLAYYAYYKLGVYVKTIYHEKSNRKNYTQWLHPDLIGLYFPVESWEDEVISVSHMLADIPVKLFSFEMKKEINISNLREYFFQAVSNSSWANEGYLVVLEISDNEEFLKELKRLSSSFGIGVIKLNIVNPDFSEILFSAQQKNSLDWDTINKLCKENPDFREFLKDIRIDINGGKIHNNEYDKIPSKEELTSIVKIG